MATSENPFSATSPWNTPVGPDADYQSSGDAQTETLRSESTPWIGANATGVYQPTPTDAMAVWNYDTSAGFGAGSAGTVTLQTPSDIQFLGGSDGWSILFSPDGNSYYEVWQGSYNASTNSYHAVYMVENSIDGSGFAPSPGISDGIRAAGASLLGGLVRTQELDDDLIPHAIAMAISTVQADDAFVYPATMVDANAGQMYQGNIPIGSRFAIPSSIDLSTLGLTPEGLALAKAFQTYGGYVVDTAGSTTDDLAYLQAGATNEQISQLQADVSEIRNLLVLVNTGTPIPSQQETPVAQPVTPPPAATPVVQLPSANGATDETTDGGNAAVAPYIMPISMPSISVGSHVRIIDGNVALNGTYSAGAGAMNVELYKGGMDLGSAALHANGTWTFTGALPPGPLSDVQAVVTDVGGNQATASSAYEVRLASSASKYASMAEYFSAGQDTGQTLFNQDGTRYLNVSFTGLSRGRYERSMTSGTFLESKGDDTIADIFAETGTMLSDTIYKDDGSHLENVYGSHQTINALGSDIISTYGSNNDFVFQPNVGLETINGFHVGRPSHDMVTLPSVDASRLGAIIARALSDGMGDTTLHFGHGIALTFTDITPLQLAAHTGDFRFHT